MRISEVAAKRKPLAVQMDEGVLNITYNASLYTPEYEAKMRKAGKTSKNGKDSEVETEDDDTSAEALSIMVADLVVGWDLEEDDSTPKNPKFVPVEVKRLNKIPIVFLSKIIRSITDDLFPNPSKSTPSGSFS